MSQSLFQRAAKIDDIAHKSLLPKDNKLAASLDFAHTNSKKHGLPDITVTPLGGQYLRVQAQLIGAKSILEIGTLGGYSSIWFASTGAHVTSLEISPKHRDVALENIANAGYKDRVDVILGPALESLPKLLDQSKQFDLIFIDAAWEEQWEYFQFATKLARKGGCIYVDNVVREILDDDYGEYQKGKETLMEKVGRVDNVTATTVTVLSGWQGKEENFIDGFMLAVVH
jgi:predicted O-methyltransferase YrrM